MSSVSQLIADEKRMTEAEVADLLARGFKLEVVQFLQARGFREAGEIRHADHTTSHSFLRQTHYPHLHIVLDPPDDLNDLLTAIYEIGWNDGSDRIATLHHRFIEAVQRPRRPSETERSIEQRLQTLETQLQSCQKS
jgi:hypothetical protein